MKDDDERWRSIDRQLRAALEPETGCVSRVVVEALRSATAPRRRTIRRPWGFVPLAVLLGVGLTLWLLRSRQPPKPAEIARIVNSREVVMYKPPGRAAIMIRAGVSRPVNSGSLMIMMRR